MATVRKLFSRKEKHEKVHGEELAHIFLQNGANLHEDVKKYLNGRDWAHEVEFGKAHLKAELNKIDKKIGSKRNHLISAAIHYAHHSLRELEVQELVQNIYQSNHQSSSELVIVNFVESIDGHDKGECLKHAAELDGAYLKQQKISLALTAMNTFVLAPEAAPVAVAEQNAKDEVEDEAPAPSPTMSK